MKKIVFILFSFFIGLAFARASNDIYSIDINIYIDKDGSANIQETWDVDGSDGTEWYKVLNNIGKSKIENFKVSMDDKPLTLKTWKINESLEQKKGYYGINYTSNGMELCFGKYDYSRHTFKLEYTLTNYIFNTSDAQVLYWNLIDKLSDVNFKKFSVQVSSYYEFPDTLDVWGYGYSGYAYVQNGVIKMSSDEKMNDNYVVLLVKFPLNTFTSFNTSSFNTFNDVYNKAEEGAYEYDHNESKPFFVSLINLLIPLMMISIPIFGIFKAYSAGYGFKNDKKINKKNTPYFRDIPCDKDIYYADTLIQLNNFSNDKSNIIGAILLKWIKTNKVTVKKDITKKDKMTLVLNPDTVLEDEIEKQLYDIMYKASNDGILEEKELEKWAKKNYTKYLEIIKRFKDRKIAQLESQGHIYKRTSKQECKVKNVMDDILFEESKKLFGLKLFLEDFSNIDTKEALEVHLWDEYLMFASLFGIADKVAKQFKNLYPEFVQQLETEGMGSLDLEMFIFLNRMSYISISAASNAAQAYSSGGGGFSSGGGGGGSFGGGGGGSR